MRLVLSVLLCLFFLFAPPAAEAQSLPGTLSGTLMVYHYLPDPAAGTPKLDRSWAFKNSLRWFNINSRFTTQQLVPREQLKFVNPKAESYVILETNADESLARKVTLQDGVMSVSIYKRRFAYYEDAADVAGYVESLRVKKLAAPSSSQPALLSVKSWAEGAPQPDLWALYSLDDALLIRSYLRDLPLVSDMALNRSETDFKGPGSVFIEPRAKSLNFPGEISLEGHRIRVAQVDVETRVYFDKVGLGGELKRQLAELTSPAAP